jgi:uptake hydrogenase large subunit
MSIEGELVVRVSTAGGRVSGASARAERPRVAGRLFAGRPADEAPVLAGTLFAICGRSQAIGSRTAIDAARGLEPARDLEAARDARIAAETVQEHAWRFLVDWPRLAGRAPDVDGLARGRKVLAPLLDAGEDTFDVRARDEAVAWARDSIFGRTPAGFLAIDSIDALQPWIAGPGTGVASLVGHLLGRNPSLGASDVDLLPYGDDRWVAMALAPAIDRDDRFDEAPHWRDGARETGALARTAGHPLVADAIARWGRGVGARVVARLVDLAAALEAAGGRHGAIRLNEASAIAWVETARGLLVHRVTLEGDRIGTYRIVAPTEWNFHPEGAFAHGAMAIPAGDAAQLESDVRWLVASLDPCVGVRYEAGHA